MFASVYKFFYNLEGVSMYVQDKIFGKYAKTLWGYRVIEITSSVIVIVRHTLLDYAPIGTLGIFLCSFWRWHLFLFSHIIPMPSITG